MAAVSMFVVVGDGTAARLWTDDWAPVGRLCVFAPDLFAAVSARGKKRTLSDGLSQNRWARDITAHRAGTRSVLVGVAGAPRCQP